MLRVVSHNSFHLLLFVQLTMLACLDNIGTNQISAAHLHLRSVVELRQLTSPPRSPRGPPPSPPNKASTSFVPDVSSQRFYMTWLCRSHEYTFFFLKPKYSKRKTTATLLRCCCCRFEMQIFCYICAQSPHY